MKVHVHGVVIRDVGVDGAGNWATHIGRQSGGRRIEAQQYKVGRPWSGWVGTNVVREDGLILSYTGNRGDRISLYQIEPGMGSWRSHGGYYEVAWPNQGYQGYNQQGAATWVLPDNGTYTFKVKGDVLIVYVTRNGGQLIDTSNSIHKISWYEPGRKIGMLFDFNLRSWRFNPDP